LIEQKKLKNAGLATGAIALVCMIVLIVVP
jgi:hypothetical protein